MNKPVKMLLLNDRKDRGRRGDMPYRGYEPEDRFRDSRGREHYDNGRFAPRGESGMWVDDRPRGDYREEYGGAPAGMRYPFRPPYPYIPPVYERGDGYGRGDRPMNRIGFALEGEMGKVPPEFDREYRTMAGYQPMDEMAHRRSGYTAGHVTGTALPPFTRETAKEWTDGMVNEDGSRGPHWTLEKAEQIMAQRNIDCDLYTFWAVLNSIYSDYCAVFKKFNINNMDVYADLAKAWIDDSDAVKDKAAAYYSFVVKH